MRKLGLKDAFALARIIKAAALRDVITEFAGEVRNKDGGQDLESVGRVRNKDGGQDLESGGRVRNKDDGQDLESVGFEFLLTLAESISDEAIEKKIYTLYADIKGISADDVPLLGFAEIKSDIKELVDQNDLKSFFTSVSALMSKQ